MSQRNIFNDVKAFEQRLGLPIGFYERLLKEDDWSFVVKLNALFEGACTHALVARLHAPEIEDPLAELELAHSTRGKIKFLTALGCITSQQSTYICKLAELRNELVHNVSRVGFTFESYVSGLDSNQKKRIVEVFGRGWTDIVDLGDVQVPRSKFVLQNTKLSVWFSAAELLACLYLEFELAELRLQTTILNGYRKLAASAGVNASVGEGPL